MQAGRIPADPGRVEIGPRRIPPPRPRRRRRVPTRRFEAGVSRAAYSMKEQQRPDEPPDPSTASLGRQGGPGRRASARHQRSPLDITLDRVDAAEREHATSLHRGHREAASGRLDAPSSRPSSWWLPSAGFANQVTSTGTWHVAQEQQPPHDRARQAAEQLC